MVKIKNTFHNMPLKTSLVSLAVLCLGVVSILTIFTILEFSNLRQEILDTRPIHISDYTIKRFGGSSGSALITPQEYGYGDLSKENQIYYQLSTVLMAALPVVYVIAGSAVMAGVYYRLKLQTPIKALKESMSHISEQDLDFQMTYTSDDELGRLCAAFEQMRGELDKRNREMWGMLKERKALTASVSHDLRTPITVIKGYLDYLDRSLNRGRLTEDMLKTTLQNMTQAAERLERYVECVKDIQKIEDIEIKKERIELRKFLSQLSKDFAVLAEQRGKQVKIQDFSRAEKIMSDEEMLSKILENIYDNALRFAEKEIRIDVTEEKDNLLFTIQDDGRGFAEEELKTAVSLFYSSPTNGGNFGIGLSISRILCGKLGGCLRLGNRSGTGAAVTIEIKK